MGNRLTKTSGDITTAYTYDLCNKLLSETTGEAEIIYSYDALGNLTEKVNGTGTTYAYDALNQLTKVTNLDGTWQSNTYDASGIRSMITENGITTELMTFNGLVLSGYDKTGEQTEHYYYGNNLLAVEYAEDANNTYADLYYYLINSHGDVIGLTDAYGTLTETYRYDAFGTLTSIRSLNDNGILVEVQTALSRFLYAGEQLDATTGLYYLRARQYDTMLGRFTQEDTYLGDGRNLYVYVRNNPLKYVDPSGHGKQDTNDIQEDENEKKKYPNPIDLLPWLFLVDLPSLPDVDINPLGLVGGNGLLDDLEFGGDAESIYNSVNSISTTNGNSESSGRGGGGRAGGGERGGGGRAGGDPYSRNGDISTAGRKTVGNYDRNMDDTPGRKSVEGNYDRNMDSTGANRQGDQSTALEYDETIYSPINTGPLPENIANTFMSATYVERILEEDTVMYRVSGGPAGKVGSYLSLTPQCGGLQSQLDLALNPAWGNTANNITEVVVPQGTTIYEGVAAPQNIYDSSGNVIGTLPGGGIQVYIPKVDEGWFK